MNAGRLIDENGICVFTTGRKTVGALERARGLLGRPALSSDEALWIEPCNSIHTFGMTYPIDVIFLDRSGKVLRVVDELKPWRIARVWSARSVVELGAGRLRERNIEIGSCLVFEPIP